MLFLKVRWFNFKDLVKTIALFWFSSPRFACIDFTLLFSYFFKSPYAIVRAFTQGLEPYGETPLVVMQQIAKKAMITKNDTVFELGSGRGRTCFWLSVLVGCKTVGVEIVPVFVQKAEGIRRYYGLQNLEFRLQDMLETDLSEASVIYLFGTCLSDENINRFIDKLKSVKRGTRIVTISYALTEYKNVPYIQLKESFEVEFPWGKTQSFLHEKV